MATNLHGGSDSTVIWRLFDVLMSEPYYFNCTQPSMGLKFSECWRALQASSFIGQRHCLTSMGYYQITTQLQCKDLKVATEDFRALICPISACLFAAPRNSELWFTFRFMAMSWLPLYSPWAATPSHRLAIIPSSLWYSTPGFCKKKNYRLLVKNGQQHAGIEEGKGTKYVFCPLSSIQCGSHLLFIISTSSNNIARYPVLY